MLARIVTQNKMINIGTLTTIDVVAILFKVLLLSLLLLLLFLRDTVHGGFFFEFSALLPLLGLIMLFLFCDVTSSLLFWSDLIHLSHNTKENG